MTGKARHETKVDHWHPATYNEMHGRTVHWGRKARLKKRDREVVGTLYAKLPKATGRRRVSLVVVMAKGKRCPDKDAYWKSLLDALKHHGMLVDDNPKHCEPGTVTFDRSNDTYFGTRIILEDVA